MEAVQTYIERPAFETVLASLKEVAAMQKETDRQMKESAKEFDQRMKESAKEFSQQMKERAEEFNQRMKETDQILKENAIQMKETDRIVGDLGNRFGEMVEHLVAPSINKRFNELGYHFDAVAPGGYIIRDNEGKTIAEVDILLENDEYIMAVEVKAKTHTKDIEHHVKRLEILRKHRNKHHDTRKIRGAIAGAIFGDTEKQAAIEAGFYVLEQSGDTVKMDMPADFVPKEW